MSEMEIRENPERDSGLIFAPIIPESQHASQFVADTATERRGKRLGIPILQRRRHLGERSHEAQLSGLRRRLGRRGFAQPEIFASEARVLLGQPLARLVRDGILLDGSSRGRFALATGHDVRLIAPTCDNPSRVSEAATAEAVRQPGIRLVEP